jgi:hypothetical protein
LTPRSAALAFRIWAYAEPLGWDCSVKDIAEALGDVSWGTVRAVLQHKNWLSRVRCDSTRWNSSHAGSAFLSDGLSQEPYASEIVQRLRRKAGL